MLRLTSQGPGEHSDGILNEGCARRLMRAQIPYGVLCARKARNGHAVLLHIICLPNMPLLFLISLPEVSAGLGSCAVSDPPLALPI